MERLVESAQELDGRFYHHLMRMTGLFWQGRWGRRSKAQSRRSLRRRSNMQDSSEKAYPDRRGGGVIGRRCDMNAMRNEVGVPALEIITNGRACIVAGGHPRGGGLTSREKECILFMLHLSIINRSIGAAMDLRINSHRAARPAEPIEPGTGARIPRRQWDRAQTEISASAEASTEDVPAVRA